MPPANSPVRAVVFDLFDTLVDLHMEDLPLVEIGGRRMPSTTGVLHEVAARVAPVPFESFARTLQRVDRDLRERRQAEGRELPTLERFTHLVERLQLGDPDLPQRLTETHMDMIRERASVPTHHPELLERLRRRAALGVCSNFSHSPTALRVLDEGALRNHFDAVVVSHDVGFRKPRREIFEATLAALGVGPEEVLHVGDNLKADVGGAGALAIRTAWLTRRVADPQRHRHTYEGPAPDWIINDLGELESILESLP